MPSKLSVQPLPPPHVSLTPPYQQLTLWIRDLLAQNQLTFSQIKALRKPFRVVTKTGGGGGGAKPVRTHRVECIIYPSTDITGTAPPVVVEGHQVSVHQDETVDAEAEATEEADDGPKTPTPPDEPLYSLVNKDKKSANAADVETRKPVKLTDPDSNPFGYIRYIDSSTEDVNSERVLIEDDDLITLVLPQNHAQRLIRPQEDEGCGVDGGCAGPEEEYLPYNDNDMMFLLPRSLLLSQTFDSSHCLSNMGTSQESEEPIYSTVVPGETAPWGRRLPAQPEAIHLHRHPYITHNQRIASEGFYQPRLPPPPAHHSNLGHSRSVPILSKAPSKQQNGVLSDSDSSGRDSPPSWISCFRSPKTRRKMTSRSSNQKSSAASSSSTISSSGKARGRQKPIRFIDDSMDSSVDKLYSSPRLVDYEDFERAEMFDRISRATRPTQTVNLMKRKSRSLSRNRYNQQQRDSSDTSVIPTREMEGLSLETRAQTTRAQVHHYNQCPPQPPPYNHPPPPPPPVSRCICDSRRSSDSGLADVSSHVDVCPLSPQQGKGSLQSVTSLQQFPSSPRLSRGGSSQALYAANSSSRSKANIRQDVNQNNLPQEDPYRNISYIDSSSASSIYPSNRSIVRCSCGQEFGFPPHQPPQKNSRRTSASQIPKSPILTRKFQASSSLPAQHSVSLDNLGQSSVDGVAGPSEQALSCADLPCTTRPIVFQHNQQVSSGPQPLAWSNPTQTPLSPILRRRSDILKKTEQSNSSASRHCESHSHLSGEPINSLIHWTHDASSSAIQSPPLQRQRNVNSKSEPLRRSTPLRAAAAAVESIPSPTQQRRSSSNPQSSAAVQSPPPLQPRRLAPSSPTAAAAPPAPPTYYTQHTMLRTEDQDNWNKTKVNYKSGLYAHWWMSASLQPIREEGLDSSSLSQ